MKRNCQTCNDIWLLHASSKADRSGKQEELKL